MGGSMKAKLLGCLFIAVILLAPSVAAAAGVLNGTWSGNWTPKGGVPDAVTVELRQDDSGTLTGKFVNPPTMDFSKASFIPKTGTILLEAADQSGKHYKLEGKVEGTELKGTLGAGEVTGELRL